MTLSRTLAGMPSSGIRDIMNQIADMTDVINLAPGEPNFPTPAHIVEAGQRALADGHTKYVSNMGIAPLREAIAEKLERQNGVAAHPDEIIVTHGAMGGLYAAFVALLDPGDEVLLPDPGWPNANMMAQLRQATVLRYRLTAATDFLPDLDELESLVTPATKLLLINTPLNPVGSVIPRARMEAILAFAAAHDLWVLCDEAYEALTYTDDFVSAAACGSRARVIGVYSFSKSYAMTGWRVGYMVLPSELVRPIADLHEATLSCGSAPGQWAALAALEGPQDVIATMRAAYASRRQRALDVLADHGVTAHPPAGAFYLWIDVRPAGLASRAFAQDLLRGQGVAVVHGDDFGPSGEGYVRASLAAAPEAIVEGLGRLGRHHARLAAKNAAPTAAARER